MPSPGLSLFTKHLLVNGRPTEIGCVCIGSEVYAITRGVLTIARLEHERYGSVEDPAAVIVALQELRDVTVDLFTFCQRVPDIQPKFSYHLEAESLAALRVEGYDHWWTKQLKNTTRNMVRKSQKLGVAMRECTYDDDFVCGMTAIFNETSVRQGRKFWHYGKTVEEVRSQFSRYLNRERLIGAFYENELVGFAMLGNAGTFGELGQIIALTKHRDKAIPNALIAKAVEFCEQDRLTYLVYGLWTDNSLTDFKYRSGFREVTVPRYFVPLSAKGRLALAIGAHHGWRVMVPGRLKAALRWGRSVWNASFAR